MNRQELIKAWQENEKPFGLLSKEMQEFARTINIDNFMAFYNLGWDTCGKFTNEIAHRLNKDYAEKPGVEKYLIEKDNDILVFNKNGINLCLYMATASTDFIRFEDEFGEVRDIKDIATLIRKFFKVYIVMRTK